MQSGPKVRVPHRLLHELNERPHRGGAVGGIFQRGRERAAVVERRPAAGARRVRDDVDHIIEADDRVSTMDFTDLEKAIGYANDAASESDPRPPVAYVVDDRFRVVHEGRHYATAIGPRKIDPRYVSTPFDWVDDDE